MGTLFFGFGSAMGAVLTWFVSQRDPGRSTVLALNGIACGLLGALTVASWRNTVPAIDVGLGFLGTTAPFTLCMMPFRAVAGRAGIAAAVRHLGATLAVALVCGIACATFGFVAVASVRHISSPKKVGEPADFSIVMLLQPAHAPGAAFPRRL